MFHIKRFADGTIKRRKAHFVAKDFLQQSGIYFQETFSPFVKPTNVSMMLALAVSKDLPIRQYDVQKAFLHGRLTEIVFTAQPLGSLIPNFHLMFSGYTKLFTGFTSPRAWYSRWSSKLVDLGFTISTIDPSLFIHSHGSSTIFVLMYVDDILIIGSSLPCISDLVVALCCGFPITDLGSLKFFLGIEATFNPHGLLLIEQKYHRSSQENKSTLGQICEDSYGFIQ